MEDSAGETFGSAIPERINLRAGEVYRLALPSAAGGGYSWEASAIGGEFEAVRIETELGTVPEQDDVPSSALAPVTLLVTAIHPGTTICRVRLVRPWQPDDPLVDRVIEIVVH